MAAELPVVAGESARLSRASTGLLVQILPQILFYLEPYNLPATKRAVDRILRHRRRTWRHCGGVVVVLEAVQAVGVTVACVADERAAALLMGRADEEDGVVGMVHANRAQGLIPFFPMNVDDITTRGASFRQSHHRVACNNLGLVSVFQIFWGNGR